VLLASAGCGPALVISPVVPAEPVPAAPSVEPAPVVVVAPSCARRASAPRLQPFAPTGAGASVAIGQLGGRTLAYVADEDERAVRTVDLASGAELALTPLGASPGQLLLTADGRVLVALRGGAAVAALEPGEDPAAPLQALCTVPTPVEPVALATTPDGARVLVTSRWGHALTVLDGGSLERLATLDLPRDPGAVVASGDGRRAFVTHVVGARISVVDLAERTARSVDLHQVERPQAFSSAKLVQWSSGQGYALARTASGRILAPGILANPSAGPDAPSSSGYGPGGAPSQIGDVAVLDEQSGKLSTTPVLAFRDHADCLLPRAAVVDDAGGRLVVACLGDGVRVYDARAPLPHQAPRRRFEVPAGPTGIALFEGGTRAVVWSQFAHTLSILAVDAPMWSGDPTVAVARRPPANPGDRFEKAPRPTTVLNRPIRAFVLPPHAPALDARAALGRELFHAAGDWRIAGDGRACASCHPDGRDDGLTWSTPDGPRQTPILAARLEGTAPYSWDGSNADLDSHVRRTVTRLIGGGLGAPQREALLAYLTHMAAPAMPAAAEPALARGAALFRSAETGCAGCHDGARSTDGVGHDVSSRVKGDRLGVFDTPSLRFVGRSAPYFHDGRYATMIDLLRGADGTMGHTGHLAEDDLRALATYVESL
jgi:mono/diheme cytochrome c family protein